MKALVFLTLLFTFSPVSHANNLERFLDGTTWCFQDRSGYWDHARLQFHFVPDNNWAFYDVTDAPGPGGASISWLAFAVGNMWRIHVGAGNTIMSANIGFEGRNRMFWYWDFVNAPSILNRCR
jgi:hypothetical protein